MLENVCIKIDKLKPLSTFIVSFKFKSDSHILRVHVCIWKKNVQHPGSCKVFLLPDNNRPRRQGKICDRDTERKREEEGKRTFPRVKNRRF